MTVDSSASVRRKRLRRGLVATTGLVAAASVLSACGSPDGSSSSSSGAGASKASLDAVAKVVAKYSAEPTFTAPGPAFDASKAAGKSVFSIPYTSSVPFDSIIDASQDAALKKFGVKVTEYSNQGQNSQWNQGIATAISQKADLISLNVINPSTIVPALSKARSKGIAVLSNQGVDVTGVSQAPSEVSAVSPMTFGDAGKLEADWVIHDTKGKASVLVVSSPDLPIAKPQTDAIQAEFDKYCPSSCKVKIIDVNTPDWATRITPSVQAALNANPDVNYVIPIYDGMAQATAAAITASHKVGKVFISTFNGTTSILDTIAKGNIVRMDLGDSLNALGLSAADQSLRILTGQKPLAQEPVAFRMFTKDNVAEAGSPASYSKGYGTAFEEGYQKLWTAK